MNLHKPKIRGLITLAAALLVVALGIVALVHLGAVLRPSPAATQPNVRHVGAVDVVDVQRVVVVSTRPVVDINGPTGVTGPTDADIVTCTPATGCVVVLVSAV